MNAFRTIIRSSIHGMLAPLTTVRSYLPSERKARRAIARRFAASVTRKAPAKYGPGLWPWAVRVA